MFRARLTLTVLAGLGLGAVGFVLGSEHTQPGMGRMIGTTIGVALGAVAGLVIRVDEASATKHHEATKVGRAIVVGLLFCFVFAFLGLLFSQYGPIGGAEEHAPAWGAIRMRVAAPWAVGGAVLGALLGAVVGVRSAKSGNRPQRSSDPS